MNCETKRLIPNSAACSVLHFLRRAWGRAIFRVPPALLLLSSSRELMSSGAPSALLSPCITSVPRPRPPPAQALAAHRKRSPASKLESRTRLHLRRRQRELLKCAASAVRLPSSSLRLRRGQRPLLQRAASALCKSLALLDSGFQARVASSLSSAAPSAPALAVRRKRRMVAKLESRTRFRLRRRQAPLLQRAASALWLAS